MTVATGSPLRIEFIGGPQDGAVLQPDEADYLPPGSVSIPNSARLGEGNHDNIFAGFLSWHTSPGSQRPLHGRTQYLLSYDGTQYVASVDRRSIALCPPPPPVAMR